MPVTLPAHAAAILPFARNRNLHATALVIGTTAPDLAYLIGRYGAFLHTPLGIVLGCVPIGVVVLVWAELLLMPVLRRTLPTIGGVQWARFAATRGLPSTAADWLRALASLALGSATHVVWDGFTHRRQLPAAAYYSHVIVEISGEAMSLPHFLQWASSFAGTAIVVVYLAWRYRTLPRMEGGTARDFLPIVSITAASALAGVAWKLEIRSLWHCFWGGVTFAVIGLTLACVLDRLGFLRAKSERDSSLSQA